MPMPLVSRLVHPASSATQTAGIAGKKNKKKTAGIPESRCCQINVELSGDPRDVLQYNRCLHSWLNQSFSPLQFELKLLQIRWSGIVGVNFVAPPALSVLLPPSCAAKQTFHNSLFSFKFCEGGYRNFRNMRLLHAPQTSTATGKLFQERGISSVADSGAKWVPAPFLRSSGNATCSLRLKPKQRIALSSVKLRGIGSRKEGNPVQATPDGISPENAEAVAREQILEKAKAESASTIDEEQEPFRDAVESGQTIGEATTELQFGAGDGASAHQAISNTSKELSGTNGKSGKEDKRKEDPEAEVSSEVWGTMEDGGNTHAFLDDEKKVDFHGEEDESVLGIGGQRASESHTENH